MSENNQSAQSPPPEGMGPEMSSGPQTGSYPPDDRPQHHNHQDNPAQGYGSQYQADQHPGGQYQSGPPHPNPGAYQGYGPEYHGGSHQPHWPPHQGPWQQSPWQQGSWQQGPWQGHPPNHPNYGHAGVGGHPGAGMGFPPPHPGGIPDSSPWNALGDMMKNPIEGLNRMLGTDDWDLNPAIPK